MNEKTLKICVCVSYALLLVGIGFLLGGNITKRNNISALNAHVSELESELGRYRDGIEHAQESERELRAALDEARVLVDGAGRSIRSLGGSVEEVRRGLADLQKYVEGLEDCLGNAGSDHGHAGDGPDTGFMPLGAEGE